MENLAVCTMVMDPTNTNVLYAGTGEGYFNVDAIRGAGIFKTTDAGATWNRLSATNNSSFYYVNKLVIDQTTNCSLCMVQERDCINPQMAELLL
ncbi:MAG: hypothetical protein MZV64_03350 [Ignavibacteriales bacterium]|nr:hypothetical protein [Ignavibacteriales bacterium]